MAGGKKGPDLRGPLARCYTEIIIRIAPPVAQVFLYVKVLSDGVSYVGFAASVAFGHIPRSGWAWGCLTDAGEAAAAGGPRTCRAGRVPMARRRGPGRRSLARGIRRPGRTRTLVTSAGGQDRAGRRSPAGEEPEARSNLAAHDPAAPTAMPFAWRPTSIHSFLPGKGRSLHGV